MFVRRVASNVICLLAVTLTSVPLSAQANAAHPPAPDGGKAEAPRASKPPEALRRLESVTWNPVKCQLTWVVSAGTRSAGQYIRTGEKAYTIDMDSAVMKFDGESRGFEAAEAERVHQIMNLIAEYAIESTIWWDRGEGVKLDRKTEIAGQGPPNREPDLAEASVPRPLSPKPQPTRWLNRTGADRFGSPRDRYRHCISTPTLRVVGANRTAMTFHNPFCNEEP